MKIRCFGNDKPDYAKYHDEEWGVPVHDDTTLFEFLILEGAQAGLNWYTILKRREGYKRAFHNFNPSKCANMTEEYLEAQRENPEIIRNKLKIYSVRKNAIAFLQIQKDFGSFHQYLWNFVNHKQIINHHESFETVPATTQISDQISKDLKKRGMSFVGSTIMYAYMQAVGIVDDHLNSCHKRREK